MEKIDDKDRQESDSEAISGTGTESLTPQVNQVQVITSADQTSLVSILCRICYDDTLDEPVVSPCMCKGSVGFVHKACLERWLAESNTNKCDLCSKEFETERQTKYSVTKSFYKWIRYPHMNFAFPIRDVRSDILTCCLLLPMSLLLIFMCLYCAEYYSGERFEHILAATWTSISIMFMGLVMLLGLFVWGYLVMRYHCRVWYFWWQRETIVKVHLNEGPMLHVQQI